MLHSKSNEHVRQCTRTKGESLKNEEEGKKTHLIYYRELCKYATMPNISTTCHRIHEKMQLRNIVGHDFKASDQTCSLVALAP